MTDRNEHLRRDLGWTGPADTDYEPQAEPPAPPKPPRSEQTRPVDPRPVAFRDPSGAFRDQRPGHGSVPPHPVRDLRPAPPSGPPPGSGPWTQQPGWQPGYPSPPTAAPGQVPSGQPWPAGYPSADGNAVPASYADRIRPEELAPPPRPTPRRGWRRVLYRATFGLVNPGPSAEEIREDQMVAKIRGPLRGHFKVGVMGKGGVGKTTVSASIGSVFAELRQNDRVVAIDADTAFGKLGSRVDPRAPGSYWELAADQQLDSFTDVRSRVGSNAAGLFVLAGEASPARRRVLDPAIYREATSLLDRHFSISVVDCSSTMDSPVTQEALSDLDALIVVTSPWIDGASAAGQTLDWLNARGLTDLLRRTVIVLNDSDGHADRRARSVLAGQFAGQGQPVVEVPFDAQLRPGGVIDGLNGMSAPARRRFIEIAALLAEHFPTEPDRTHRP